MHELQLLVRVSVWGWVRVMVEIEFGTSFAFRGWVRVLGYGFGVRGRNVKSRDCALVGLQPTVIASRAPHLLIEQRIQRIVDVHRPSTARWRVI